MKFLNTVTESFLSFMGEEKGQTFRISVFSIFISILAGSLLMLLLGKNPLLAYQSLLQGSGLLPKSSYAAYKSMLTDFMIFLNALTPMIFASLAVAVALRAGLFNIGVAGQMLCAGFVATVTVGYSLLPSYLAKPLVIILALLAGGALGALIGWLKYRFNINEVVSSIMINYIVQYITSFMINTRYLNPVSRQSNPISRQARLSLMDTPVGDLKMDIPLGIILAVLAALLLHFFLNRTTFGFELKAVGKSRGAALYGGMNVGRNIVLAMFLSGALAGLAGATYYLGYFASIQPKVLAATGFDAIAVSLLANSHPAGILLSSFLITVISRGSTYMNSASGIEGEMAAVLTGIILVFSACTEYIRTRIYRARLLRKEAGDGTDHH